MNADSYNTTFTVDQSPETVFAAINDVRAWWTGKIVGPTDQLGQSFTYRFEKLHRSVQQVTELVPGKAVVWHVVDGHLTFVSNKTEWTGTDIRFDIARKGDKTEVHFTHVGLVPAFECFNDCANGWGFYINGRLRELIMSR